MYISRGHYPPIIENQIENNNLGNPRILQYKQWGIKWTDSRTPAESLLASSDKNEVPDFWL